MGKSSRLYWICQIMGWGAYSAIGLWTAVLDHGWRPSAVYGYILFFLYDIGLTHLLRALIHRRGWTSLPLPRMLPRLAAASIVIGAIQTVLVVGVYTAIEGTMGFWRGSSAIAFLFMGVTVATTVWTVLYLTITTMRHSREARRNEMTMKLALSDAELRALEAQINPHFLFNCLNSIRGMIVEDAPQAQDMVTRLANILRYSLQRDRTHTVPLAVEMEAVEDYLALESIRFDERLRVQVDVADDARPVEIPAMMLQTLVENAIKHGVERAPQGGLLAIRAARDADRLCIEVENSGSLHNPPAESTQIGLANAREHLRILYAGRASMSLLASAPGRVTATIVIPAAP